MDYLQNGQNVAKTRLDGISSEKKIAKLSSGPHLHEA